MGVTSFQIHTVTNIIENSMRVMCPFDLGQKESCLSLVWGSLVSLSFISSKYGNEQEEGSMAKGHWVSRFPSFELGVMYPGMCLSTFAAVEAERRWPYRQEPDWEQEGLYLTSSHESGGEQGGMLCSWWVWLLRVLKPRQRGDTNEVLNILEV